MKLLYYSIIIVLTTYSCQSEYQRQLSKARKLVIAEQEIKNSYSSDFKTPSAEFIKDINDKIRFQAHMSGNEDYFLNEVDNYRKSLETKRNAESPMITRFP